MIYLLFSYSCLGESVIGCVEHKSKDGDSHFIAELLWLLGSSLKTK